MLFRSRKIKTNKKIKSAVTIGARDRYFCIVFFNGHYTVLINRQNKIVSMRTNVPAQKSLWNFYLGPQLQKELTKYKLADLIYYGFFHVIGVLILKILYGLNYITHNWGWSIILLSIIIYFSLFPFTAKSMKSMKRMQIIQPKIKILQTKYKDNPHKLQKEQMLLFKKYKVNPLGGCLPMLFQFPVFIALYQVLLRFVELKGAHFLWIQDLSLPDHTFQLSFSLPWIGKYINILPLLYMVLSYFQQKVTTSGVNSQQKSTATIFVLFMGIIFYNFPSSLMLYWFMQSLLTFAYQYKISKSASQLA